MEKKKLLFVGIVSGLCCGLFASGGGLILLPCLSFFINIGEKEARATTTLCILPMVIVGLFFYNSFNNIDYKLGLLCSIGGCIGGIIGTKLLKKLNNKILKIFFVIFLIVSSILLFNK